MGQRHGRRVLGARAAPISSRGCEALDAGFAVSLKTQQRAPRRLAEAAGVVLADHQVNDLGQIDAEGRCRVTLAVIVAQPTPDQTSLRDRAYQNTAIAQPRNQERVNLMRRGDNYLENFRCFWFCPYRVPTSPRTNPSIVHRRVIQSPQQYLYPIGPVEAYAAYHRRIMAVSIAESCFPCSEDPRSPPGALRALREGDKIEPLVLEHIIPGIAFTPCRFTPATAELPYHTTTTISDGVVTVLSLETRNATRLRRRRGPVAKTAGTPRCDDALFAAVAAALR